MTQLHVCKGHVCASVTGRCRISVWDVSAFLLRKCQGLSQGRFCVSTTSWYEHAFLPTSIYLGDRDQKTLYIRNTFTSWARLLTHMFTVMLFRRVFGETRGDERSDIVAALTVAGHDPLIVELQVTNIPLCMPTSCVTISRDQQTTRRVIIESHLCPLSLKPVP